MDANVVYGTNAKEIILVNQEIFFSRKKFEMLKSTIVTEKLSHDSFL